MKEYTSDLKSNNNFGSAMEHYISDLKGPQLSKEGMVLIKIHSDETSLMLVTDVGDDDVSDTDVDH